MSEITEAFTAARLVLEREAIRIHDVRPDDFGTDLRIAGPSTAVALVIDAMWQRPDVVPAIAAYFEALARTRVEEPGVGDG